MWVWDRTGLPRDTTCPHFPAFLPRAGSGECDPTSVWRCQHRAAARPSSTTEAQTQRNGRKQKHSQFPLPELLPYHTRSAMPALAEWTFGEMQRCYEQLTHWHSFTTNTKAAFMLTSTLFCPHFSHDATKAAWAQGSWWDVPQNAWKPPGLAKGLLHKTRKIFNQDFSINQGFLTSYWALWEWSQPWCVSEKIVNSWNNFLGKVMNGPLGAFSFKTCVPRKHSINISMSCVSGTIPFNTNILWFSSLASSPAGQHFVTQGISKSPPKLFQSKLLIILKIPRLTQIHF